jgi:lysophospholipase L1-like esterase
MNPERRASEGRSTGMPGGPARLWLPSIVLVASLLPGCGDSPTQPDPVGPAITCPADMQALSHGGQPAVVTYATPVASGGSPPVSTTCSPASGSAFPVGTTRVTCTAVDNRQRSAACAFAIAVAPVPVVSYTRFVAFGDSVTEGTTSPDPTTLLLSVTDSYPYKLQNLMTERYLDQTITVLNRGRAGELAWPDGVRRFPTVLDADHPEVVLLLDGFNDLLCAASTRPPCGRNDPFAAVPVIAGALEDMIHMAQDRGVRVLLANFPPQDPNGSRGDGAAAVPAINAAIARLAADERVVLVDLYNGLGGTPVGSIGVDGLHPTDTGYTKIANIWFEAIQHEYERQTGSSTAPSPTLLRRIP